MLMKIQEVARVLRIPVDRCYAIARKGVIPVVRIGRQIRVDQDQLAAWIEDGGWELEQRSTIRAELRETPCSGDNAIGDETVTEDNHGT